MVSTGISIFRYAALSAVSLSSPVYRGTDTLIKGRLLIAILLLASCLSACSNLAFQPSRKFFYDPRQFGMDYENVRFESRDGTMLHGWFIPARGDGDSRGTVLQFHGNAENITTHFLSLAWITKEGYNLLIFDYRGYGQSGGKPNHAGIHEDALAALDYAITRKVGGEKPPRQLVVYGQSIGGTILLRALSDLEDKSLIDAVVVESAFSSYERVAREKLSLTCLTWPFQGLTPLLMSDRYAPEKVMDRIAPTPLLVIHGDADAIIPLHHGRRLFDLAGEPKWFWQVEGGRHISAMFHDQGRYRKRLLDFLDPLRPASRGE